MSMHSAAYYKTSPLHDSLRGIDNRRLRRIIRQGSYRGHTAGLADGKLQANLIVISSRFAEDFLKFCIRNPKPLPLVGVNRAGEPVIASLGQVDLRTDIPLYDVYRFGALAEQRTNIMGLWREDFAAFALGCSFTFDHALRERGIELRYICENKTIPKFRTSIKTVRVGPFGGDVVVSMRPIRHDAIDKVRAITARYPHAHGAPVHVGDPSAIGISCLDSPDWGDPVEIRRDEVPVFWACGVTAHNALQRAKLDICIAQTPGHMLVTDVDGRTDIGPFKLF
jgi:uncharacterized protein YcsI (UPF0317 family)